MYFHNFWASLRPQGVSPARAGPPGGFRGSEKTLYFAGFRRHGGFRGLEKRVFFIGFWLPAESEGAKTLHFHRFWASGRFSTSGRSAGERYPCVFIGIGLPGGIQETPPPGQGLPAGPGRSENFVLSQVLGVPAAGKAKNLKFS